MKTTQFLFIIFLLIHSSISLSQITLNTVEHDSARNYYISKYDANDSIYIIDMFNQNGYDFSIYFLPNGELKKCYRIIDNDFFHKELDEPLSDYFQKEMRRIDDVDRMGTVVLVVLYDENSKIIDLRIIKSICYSCDEEAKRLVTELNKKYPVCQVVKGSCFINYYTVRFD